MSTTQIHTRRIGNIVIVKVEGPIRSGETEAAFTASMQAVFDGGDRQVVLDLSLVPHVDSTGLGRILQAVCRMERAGGMLKLLDPSKYVRNLLVITKVGAMLAVFDTLDAAVGSFADQTVPTTAAPAIGGVRAQSA